MSRIAYVNGQYLPRSHAAVHIEDRGYQFSDGVYEVCEVRGGRLVDQRRHMERLVRSLGELRIRLPMPLSALNVVLHEVVARNRIKDGIVYVQMTRGVARRDHPFPPSSTKPAIVVTANSLDVAKSEAMAADGVAVITLPDNRWERVDIKAIALLPNVLAKQAARERGAREAWYVDKDNRVTEGASSNAWIVTRDGKVVTRQADHGILKGITRAVVIDTLRAHGLELEERPFTIEEAYEAREAFLTSASQLVMPVVRINGRPVGNGAPGLISTALRRDFHRH
ncbi:MAG TPA: D-amino-acid transaminase, partial [Pseudorhodoplanes sp.]|nr:D-amino-acid transaminase [Pseudorhodoplanes sp.]